MSKNDSKKNVFSVLILMGMAFFAFVIYFRRTYSITSAIPIIAIMVIPFCFLLHIDSKNTKRRIVHSSIFLIVFTAFALCSYFLFREVFNLMISVPLIFFLQKKADSDYVRTVWDRIFSGISFVVLFLNVVLCLKTVDFSGEVWCGMQFFCYQIVLTMIFVLHLFLLKKRNNNVKHLKRGLRNEVRIAYILPAFYSVLSQTMTIVYGIKYHFSDYSVFFIVLMIINWICFFVFSSANRNSDVYGFFKIASENHYF